MIDLMGRCWEDCIIELGLLFQTNMHILVPRCITGLLIESICEIGLEEMIRIHLYTRRLLSKVDER